MKHALVICLVTVAAMTSLCNAWLAWSLRSLSALQSRAGAESEKLRREILRLESVRAQWQAHLAGRTWRAAPGKLLIPRTFPPSRRSRSPPLPRRRAPSTASFQLSQMSPS